MESDLHYNGQVAAIVLAAGRSRRFGGDKRLYAMENASLLKLSLSKPLALNLPTFLVLRRDDAGRLAHLLGEYLGNANLSILFAKDAEQGLGHSLAYAARHLQNAKATLVFLADMPWVELTTIQKIISNYYPGKVTIPTFNKKWGHPIMFSSEWYALLQNVSGDKGAKELLNNHPLAIVEIETSDENILKDIDVPLIPSL